MEYYMLTPAQLRMRGQRVKMNSNGDGEVDENFWAQAAADQAAGRMGEQDDSKPNVNPL
jgi:condensin complex subunit 2